MWLFRIYFKCKHATFQSKVLDSELAEVQRSTYSIYRFKANNKLITTRLCNLIKCTLPRHLKTELTSESKVKGEKTISVNILACWQHMALTSVGTCCIVLCGNTNTIPIVSSTIFLIICLPVLIMIVPGWYHLCRNCLTSYSHSHLNLKCIYIYISI